MATLKLVPRGLDLRPGAGELNPGSLSRADNVMFVAPGVLAPRPRFQPNVSGTTDKGPPLKAFNFASKIWYWGHADNDADFRLSYTSRFNSTITEYTDPLSNGNHEFGACYGGTYAPSFLHSTDSIYFCSGTYGTWFRIDGASVPQYHTMWIPPTPYISASTVGSAFAANTRCAYRVAQVRIDGTANKREILGPPSRSGIFSQAIGATPRNAKVSVLYAQGTVSGDIIQIYRTPTSSGETTATSDAFFQVYERSVPASARSWIGTSTIGRSGTTITLTFTPTQCSFLSAPSGAPTGNMANIRSLVEVTFTKSTNGFHSGTYEVLSSSNLAAGTVDITIPSITGASPGGTAYLREGGFIVDDWVGDGYLTKALYTNPDTGESDDSANYPLPSAQATAFWRGRIWGGNTQGLSTFDLRLMSPTSTSGDDGLQADDTITINGVVFQAKASPVNPWEFQLVTSGSTSENIRRTAENLCYTINRYLFTLNGGASTNYSPGFKLGVLAEYASEPSVALDVGLIRLIQCPVIATGGVGNAETDEGIRRFNYGFDVYASRPTAWIPALTQQFSSTAVTVAPNSDTTVTCTLTGFGAVPVTVTNPAGNTTTGATNIAAALNASSAFYPYAVASSSGANVLIRRKYVSQFTAVSFSGSGWTFATSTYPANTRSASINAYTNKLFWSNEKYGVDGAGLVDNFAFIGESTSVIVALSPLKDALIVWTTKGIYSITGYAPDISIEPLLLDETCVSGASVAEYEDKAWGLCRSGVIEVTANSAKVVSDSIAPFISLFIAGWEGTANTAQPVRGNYLPSLKAYVLCFPETTYSASVGIKSSGQTYVYHLPSESWVRWGAGGLSFTNIQEVDMYGGTVQNERVLIAAATPYSPSYLLTTPTGGTIDDSSSIYAQTYSSGTNQSVLSYTAANYALTNVWWSRLPMLGSTDAYSEVVLTSNPITALDSERPPRRVSFGSSSGRVLTGGVWPIGTCIHGAVNGFLGVVEACSVSGNSVTLDRDFTTAGETYIYAEFGVPITVQFNRISHYSARQYRTLAFTLSNVHLRSTLGTVRSGNYAIFTEGDEDTRPKFYPRNITAPEEILYLPGYSYNTLTYGGITQVKQGTFTPNSSLTCSPSFGFYSGSLLGYFELSTVYVDYEDLDASSRNR